LTLDFGGTLVEPPPEMTSRTASMDRAVCSGLAEQLLELLLETLEHRPHLVARLQRLFALQESRSIRDAQHMTVAAYARHRCVSERTIRYQVRDMLETVHYHRDGRTRRRVIIHVDAADRWNAERSQRLVARATSAGLVVDQVTQFRARAALNKRKER
jgi:hypothetical protein